MQALTQEKQQNYINKIYSRAVEVCEPVITESEVLQVNPPLFSSLRKTKPISTLALCSIYLKALTTEPCCMKLTRLHQIRRKYSSSSSTLTIRWPSRRKKGKTFRWKLSPKKALKSSLFQFHCFHHRLDTSISSWFSFSSLELYIGGSANLDKNHRKKITSAEKRTSDFKEYDHL